MAGLSRTLGIFSAFMAVVGAAFYPIYFRPLLLPEEYKQSINRAGVVQADIQPAGTLDLCVCIDCFKDLLEIRPEYVYGFK
uniref:Small integral membrane protein 20 n=1 Tax=Cyanoderma ruficeps TaxID=181631 RepID=A0A8C3NZB8_9PASS